MLTLRNASRCLLLILLLLTLSIQGCAEKPTICANACPTLPLEPLLTESLPSKPYLESAQGRSKATQEKIRNWQHLVTGTSTTSNATTNSGLK